MSSVVSALVIKAIFDKYNVTHNIRLLGPVLAFIGTISYLGAAGAYYLAGKHYSAFKNHTKYRSFFAKDRQERGYDKDGFKVGSEEPDYDI